MFEQGFIAIAATDMLIACRVGGSDTAAGSNGIERQTAEHNGAETGQALIPVDPGRAGPDGANPGRAP